MNEASKRAQATITDFLALYTPAGDQNRSDKSLDKLDILAGQLEANSINESSKARTALPEPAGYLRDGQSDSIVGHGCQVVGCLIPAGLAVLDVDQV